MSRANSKLPGVPMATVLCALSSSKKNDFIVVVSFARETENRSSPPQWSQRARVKETHTWEVKGRHMMMQKQ